MVCVWYQGQGRTMRWDSAMRLSSTSAHHPPRRTPRLVHRRPIYSAMQKLSETNNITSGKCERDAAFSTGSTHRRELDLETRTSQTTRNAPHIQIHIYTHTLYVHKYIFIVCVGVRVYREANIFSCVSLSSRRMCVNCK